MKLRYAVVLVQSFFLAATLDTATSAPISHLYIFGDSLSDPGNNAIRFGSDPTATPPFNVTLQSDITGNTFIPIFPYAASYQYTNGNVWAYQCATMLGLPPAVAGPVLGGGPGANYASGGAATGPLNNSGPVPSLLTQTATFVTSLGTAPRCSGNRSSRRQQRRGPRRRLPQPDRTAAVSGGRVVASAVNTYSRRRTLTPRTLLVRQSPSPTPLRSGKPPKLRGSEPAKCTSGCG